MNTLFHKKVEQVVSLSHFRNIIGFTAPLAMYFDISILLYPVEEKFKHAWFKKILFSFRNIGMKNAAPHIVVRHGDPKSFSKH